MAEVESLIVGTLVVGWDGWRAHMYRLAIDDAHRRCGIARALVAEALRRVSALGATRVDAMVATSNASGVAFWQGAGFEFDRADRRWSLMLNAR